MTVSTPGRFVVTGEGVAVVVATGVDTRLADIATLTAGSRAAPQPVGRRAGHLVRRIGSIAVGVGLLFFGVLVVLG